MALARFVATLLAQPLGAVVLRGKPLLHGKNLVSMPMHMFRADCSTVQASRSKMPGAGMNPESIVPFQTVLKDGFFGVDCIDDYMFTYGDKFGNNKFSYKLQETANVSIVLYNQHVAKEDRQPMTPGVCFSFCRTIPEMSFFGIRNGDTCYCTPYFESIEGDDSLCDVVCEGDGSVMCGSKTKSSVFGMHTCSNTAQELQESHGKVNTVKADLMKKQTEVNSTSEALQSAAQSYQLNFGMAGDTVASDLMQTAKVEAGVLSELAGKSKTLTDRMSKALLEANALKDKDLTAPDTMTQAEDLLDKMDEMTAEGEATFSKLERALDASAPSNSTAVNASKQFYPLMYFVDKAHVHRPTTCGGESAHPPLVGNLDTCADACNRLVHSCVGYAFLNPAGSMTFSQGLCFLMSKFDSAVAYNGTACHDGVKCMAKLSKFEGTSLAPQGDGKCDQCLKKVTVTEGCF